MEEAAYAIVEQMGHRRFGARVRETDFCGARMLECVLLTEPAVMLRINPSSLYALTECSEEQARKACQRWGLPSDIQGLLPAPAKSDVIDQDDDPFEPSEPECHPPAPPDALTLRLGAPLSEDHLRAAVVYLRALDEDVEPEEAEKDARAYADTLLLALEDRCGLLDHDCDEDDRDSDRDAVEGPF